MSKGLQFDGATLAARYAFMPNKLRYCGGDRNSEIFGYVAHQESDYGLENMLKEFQTMFPYLRLIAESNQIADPFNYKVVEAYWIGNELLENITMNKFYSYLVDEQQIKKKFKLNMLEKVFGKIPVGAKPHHSFHVLNIPKRTGYYPVDHTIETINECIINIGKVKATNIKHETSKNKIDFSKKILVEYRPIKMENDKIKLGEISEKEVWSELNKKAFVDDLKEGDYVSLHWGWICDKLNKSQVKNLIKWTNYNLALANLR